MMTKMSSVGRALDHLYQNDGAGPTLQLFLFLFISLFIACNSSWADPSTQLSTSLEWPQVTRETKPWSRWWWMGSIVNEQDLTAEMEKYQKAGLGGLEITPIYGVKGYEDRFINYLSPRWVEMLDFTLREADRLDMGIDMATGNGWPFGGPWVAAETACKNVVCKTYNIKAGEALTEPIVYVQKPMVRAIGRRVDISELVEPISANENLQALALEQVRFEKELPLQVLMAYSDQGRILNLKDKVKEDGMLDWVAPEGSWTLYAVFQGWHGKMVERAGPGGEGNVIDHFSEDALKKYLAEFDNAYASRDVSLLRAYFNDSYEVDDASGESNWTDNFFEEFKQRRGYDIRNHLSALFGNDSVEKNARVLCDYRETISDLLLEKFTIPWHRWAKGKGATTRNQAHGSPANLLDLYAASGIPETEGSDILGFKLASSAAHVMGKKLASAEAATWLDEHFCASLSDVKQALDWFFLGGINHICYHGTTFSPPDEDWPGWLFYASVHFGPTNSFWNDFSALNSYVTRCQSFLQDGHPDNDILLYLPIYDQWSQAGRSMLQHFRATVSGTARDVGQEMLSAGYTFDFISDRQLAETEIRSKKSEVRILSPGGGAYKTVIVPECSFIPLETFQKLVDLAQQGATIIVHNNMPFDVPGWGNLEERRSVFQQTLAQINFAEVENLDIQNAGIGSGRFLLGSNLNQLLSYAQVERESMVEYGLQFVRRKNAQSYCYFVINTDSDNVDGWITLQKSAKSVAIFEPMFGQTGLAAIRDNLNGTDVYLQLAPGQSCILKTFDTVIDEPFYQYVKTTGQPQQIKGTWTVSFVEAGPELPPDVEIQQLGSWTNYGGEAVHPVRENSDDPAFTHKLFSNGVKIFSGTAKYTISFEKPNGQADGWILDLGRVCESAKVFINGRELGVCFCSPYRITILEDIIDEKNVLEIKVSNLMANRIADLDRRNVNWKKFYNVNFPARLRENRGEDGLFNASDWPAKDSGLIGPVTLTAIELMDPQSSKDKRLVELPVHDPFILPHKQSRTYYLYTSAVPRATGLDRYGVMAYKSKDLLSWYGPYVVFLVPDGIWANPMHGTWAPEVHKYKGKYYLFVTLHNRDKVIAEPPKVWRVNHWRGTIIAESSSPEGPFKLLKEDGPHTPENFMTLDGTLYVDKNGQPWMVYCHEWIQVIDGTMEAIRLKDDLSAAVGDPIHLFKASDAPWINAETTPSVRQRQYVTDGPEVYRTKNDQLVMLWSSYNKDGYVQTIARSKSGELTGPWEQLEPLVYGDSGHGMIFKTFDGQLMLVLHQPFRMPLSRAKIYEMEDAGDNFRVVCVRHDLHD